MSDFTTTYLGLKLNSPLVPSASPLSSSLDNLRRMEDAGAGAVVLYSLFEEQINLDTLDVVPHLNLSTPEEHQALRVPLRWIALLYGRVPVDLALSTGVHTADDALKGVLAGANVVMMASALMMHGISWLSEVKARMLRWMEAHEYDSITQMCGSVSQKRVPFPAAFERASYIKLVGTGH